MAFKHIKNLNGIENRRALFYLDFQGEELPPTTHIAPGSECRALDTKAKWILSSDREWLLVPADTSGSTGGIADAPFDGVTYGRKNGNWVEITNGGTFTNATPTPVKVGGISAGSTFDQESMESMWNKLLYPYLAPTANVTIIHPTGLLERGLPITNVQVRFQATGRSNKLDWVKGIRTDATSVNIVEEQTINNFNFATTVTQPAVPNLDTITYQMWANDEKQTVTASASIRTAYPIYYKVGAFDELNFTKEIVAPKNELTVTVNGNGNIQIRVPQSWGTPSQIFDQNGFEITSDFTTSPQNLNVNAGATNVAYYKIEKDNPVFLSGDYDIIIKF